MITKVSIAICLQPKAWDPAEPQGLRAPAGGRGMWEYQFLLDMGEEQAQVSSLTWLAHFNKTDQAEL